MSTEELDKLLEDKECTIEEVIQAIIQLNGIEGVGKISLGDTLRDFCYHRAEDYRSTSSEGGEEWQSNHRNGTT